MTGRKRLEQIWASHFVEVFPDASPTTLHLSNGRAPSIAMWVPGYYGWAPPRVLALRRDDDRAALVSTKHRGFSKRRNVLWVGTRSDLRLRRGALWDVLSVGDGDHRVVFGLTTRVRVREQLMPSP